MVLNSLAFLCVFLPVAFLRALAGNAGARLFSLPNVRYCFMLVKRTVLR